jgi:hypothetical protein
VTGFKGVAHAKGGHFRAYITKNQKRIELGTFKTPEEAHAAYIAVARGLFGEFANSGSSK